MKKDNQNQSSGIGSLTQKLLPNDELLKINGTYSNPSQSMLDNLENTRNLPFFKRLFKNLGPGSLRAAVINFVRMTTGVGIMALPFYLSKFGVILGVFLFLIAGCLTYNAFIFNFEAQKESKKKQMDEVVAYFLPSWVVKIFRVTICMDLIIPPMVYVVMGWNIFIYLLFIFGKYQEKWIIDPYKLLFHDYDPSLFMVRAIFLNIIYILMIPLFLKRSLESLKFLSICFLAVFLLLILTVFIQAPFFYKEYHNSENISEQTDYFLFKNINNLSFIGYGFSILLAFYGQPYVLTIRNQVLNPTMRRLRKITRINITCNLILYISFAIVGYIVWGEKYTPSLIILRKSIESGPVLEIFFKIILIIFFILVFAGIASFNPTLRESYIKIMVLKGMINF